MKPVILIGGGGHGWVVRALLEELDVNIAGVADPALSGEWDGVPVLPEDALPPPDAVDIAIGVGQLPRTETRRRLFERFSAGGYRIPTLVHPAAWVARNATLAEGVQIMAGAVVQPGTTIAAGSIINTRAGVDHDCSLGAHIHIAPGATLCGDVTIGDDAFVGAGAVVLQGRTVAAGQVVPAAARVG